MSAAEHKVTSIEEARRDVERLRGELKKAKKRLKKAHKNVERQWADDDFSAPLGSDDDWSIMFNPEETHDFPSEEEMIGGF